MGSFLEKPITTKETHSLDGNALRAAVSAMQGWRVDMEDSHIMQIGIDKEPLYSFFGVFDGHGGSLVSQTSAKKLIEYILDTPEWKSGDRSEKVVSEAIRRGFLNLDDALRLHPSVQHGDDHSGSTAITALVTPTHVFVGNCGDSRAILVREGNAVEMSHDHKPYLPAETARIEAAGGTVAMRRVNGDLAVSRALGDFVYKQGRDIRPEQQQVSAEPDVKVEPRDSQADEFLVLACDGIWDVMSNQEVASFVWTKTREGCDNLGQLAELLIDEGLARNSRDNMSCVIVAFPAAPRASADVIARYNEVHAASVAAASRKGAGGGGGGGDDDPSGGSSLDDSSEE